MQETKDWAKHYNQLLVFLQLDFAKAYDKVSWAFFFITLKKMGMAKEFIGMVDLLFKNAIIALICLNGGIAKTLRIGRRIRPGCPLTPYLFIFVGEDLNFMVKEVERLGGIRSIFL